MSAARCCTAALASNPNSSDLDFPLVSILVTLSPANSSADGAAAGGETWPPSHGRGLRSSQRHQTERGGFLLPASAPLSKYKECN